MQQTTVIEKNVQDYQIDPKIGAVKLIEALLEMGKINQATYTNINPTLHTAPKNIAI